ncbi:MAG: hypothetical protein CME70_07395 [Halobacteriovorax sp.]|nr:hypothetical protein [Halobacteriovorax sp.]|tara:strand:- start:362614 stop:363543 length:930 start_codon:yes stop_codon:yes gene_type:complete
MNKIQVSQGHERSISLEVFLKSFLTLNKTQQSKFCLHVFEEDLTRALASMQISFDIKKDCVFIVGSALKCNFLKSIHSSKSFTSLESALENISDGDILLTLPTSKDQLFDSNNHYTGHTDYFRKRFNKEDIVMLFVSEHINLALLTEHISLSEVEDKIKRELILSKISNLVSSSFDFKRFIFTGINPHCGESGLIGSKDELLKNTIKVLGEAHKELVFEGPISGDTFLSNTVTTKKSDCFISPFHDQGLAPFKAISGYRASNITIGLPFLRLSPDHGTAFELYDKDKANYFGTLFTMKLALEKLGHNGN